MAAGGHIGNVTWKQIYIESCVIPLFLLHLAWRINFWHRFCILTSPTIKIQDGRLRPYWKCNFKENGHRNPCNITFPTKSLVLTFRPVKIHKWCKKWALCAMINRKSDIIPVSRTISFGVKFSIWPLVAISKFDVWTLQNTRNDTRK